MPKVIAVAKVEDAARWEEGFKTHGDLFRSQTVNSTIRYGTTDANEIAIIFEPENLETYLEVMGSPATAEAMAFDGIDRESVRLFVIDGEFDPSG